MIVFPQVSRWWAESYNTMMLPGTPLLYRQPLMFLLPLRLSK